jgi:hypothetical protein
MRYRMKILRKLEKFVPALNPRLQNSGARPTLAGRKHGLEGQSEQERKCENEYRRLHNENCGTATLFPERVFKKIF